MHTSETCDQLYATSSLDLDIVEALRAYLEIKSDLERTLSNLSPPSERDRQEIKRLRRVSQVTDRNTQD